MHINLVRELQEDPQLPKNIQKQFQYFFNLQGEIFKKIDNRLTQRIELNQFSYFIKTHTGVGFREILKNLFLLRTPVISAMNEVKALAHLKHHKIDTLEVVGYGEQGINPATRNSFLITKALENTYNLQEICEHFSNNNRLIPWHYKHKLIQMLAEQVYKMHQSGMNHRDCYLVHFRIAAKYIPKKNIPKESQETARCACSQSPECMQEHMSNETRAQQNRILKGEAHMQDELCVDLKTPLFILDLHRAQRRKSVPERWLRKDLAGLCFSYLPFMTSQKDLLRFMRFYTRLSLRESFSNSLWKDVYLQALKIFKKHKHRKNIFPITTQKCRS